MGKFIPNLSKLLAPISALKKKKAKAFLWTKEHDQHFEAIQRALMNTRILRHPDLTKRFYVQTDAITRFR